MNENTNKKMIVLIVDDNPNNLKMLMDYLKESGFKLVVAQNGQEALDRVEVLIPDIILLDIMMPVLNGYDTCKRLKSDERFKDIPVIYMTALSDTTNKIKAFETGAVDYITKPFHQEEILARIRMHITLQQQKRELAELNAMKNLFLSIVAHDIRASINPLFLGTEVLARMIMPFKDEKLKAFVGTLKKSAENANKLMTNLLEWSKLHRGQLQYHPIQLNIQSLIHQNVELLMEKANHKQIQIQHDISQHMNAYGDYQMLNTVIRNIVSNAIKFTHVGGSIFIAARYNEKNMIEFSITDNGVGIETDIIDQLFRIDHQYKTIGTDGEIGSGLGLKLCRDMVTINKGSIWVESELDKGTTFYFTLPPFCKDD